MFLATKNGELTEDNRRLREGAETCVTSKLYIVYVLDIAAMKDALTKAGSSNPLTSV